MVHNTPCPPPAPEGPLQRFLSESRLRSLRHLQVAVLLTRINEPNQQNKTIRACQHSDGIIRLLLSVFPRACIRQLVELQTLYRSRLQKACWDRPPPTPLVAVLAAGDPEGKVGPCNGYSHPVGQVYRQPDWPLHMHVAGRCFQADLLMEFGIGKQHQEVIRTG